MIQKAREYCRRCHVCQVVLARAPLSPGTGTREPAGFGQHVYIDHGHVGQDGESVEKQFLVMVNQASGFVAAAPVQSRNAYDTVAALHSLV